MRGKMASPATDPIEAQPDRRGRRRGDVLVAAILQAVIDQLESVGYAKLTMEGVAIAAGTGKAALYRRWANKDELVSAALRRALPSPMEVALSGDVRKDIIALLGCMRDSFGVHGAAFQVVKAEGGDALLHGAVQQRVVEPCQDLILRVLEAGAQRGEVRPSAVNPQVASVGPAMLIHHSLTKGIDIRDDYLAAIVDGVILPMIRP